LRKKKFFFNILIEISTSYIFKKKKKTNTVIFIDSDYNPQADRQAAVSLIYIYIFNSSIFNHYNLIIKIKIFLNYLNIKMKLSFFMNKIYLCIFVYFFFIIGKSLSYRSNETNSCNTTYM